VYFVACVAILGPASSLAKDCYTMRKEDILNDSFSFQAGSPGPSLNSHQQPEPQSPVGASSGPPPPVPRHNYANLNGAAPPTSLQQPAAQHHNGARPRTTNPLYAQKSAFDFDRTYSEMDRTVGPVISYEAETLRADTKVWLNAFFKLTIA
jgi:hypothetical protein